MHNLIHDLDSPPKEKKVFFRRRIYNWVAMGKLFVLEIHPKQVHVTIGVDCDLKTFQLSILIISVIVQW